MKRLPLALFTLLAVGCYERTVVVADPLAGEPGDGSMPRDDLYDDAAVGNPPPDMEDGDPPITDGQDADIFDEDAAQSADAGRSGRRLRDCRRCNVDTRSQCYPPFEHRENQDCYECGCCETDEVCDAWAPRANLICIPRRDGTGLCVPNLSGVPIP